MDESLIQEKNKDTSITLLALLKICSNIEIKRYVSVCVRKSGYTCEGLNQSTSWVLLYSSLVIIIFLRQVLTGPGDHPFCQTDWAEPLQDPLVYVAPPTLGLWMSATKPCFLCGCEGQELRP